MLNTVPYAMVLVLLGIASQQKIIIVLAASFMIGSLIAIKLGYSENVANLVGLSLCGIAVGVTMTNASLAIEHFQQGSVAPSAGTYESEQNPGVAPTQECSIYYVPNEYRNTCDLGYFQMTDVQLNSRLSELNSKASLTPEEDTAKQHINKVLRARSEVAGIPSGGKGCKLSLGNNMKSQLVFDYTDRDTIQSRNARTPQGDVTSLSGHWAKCWAEFDTNDSAANYANTFNDQRGQIVATRNKVVSFTDSPKYYSELSINSLDYNNIQGALCSVATTRVETNDVFIGFAVNASKIIVSYDAYSIMNNEIVSFSSLSQNNNANDVYSILFEYAVIDNALYFRPKQSKLVDIVKINLNFCNKLQGITRSATSFSMSDIGIQPQLISTIPSGVNFTGDMLSLETQRDDIVTQLHSYQANLEELESKEKQITTPAPGLYRSYYNLINTTTVPSLLNKSQMDSLFRTGVQYISFITVATPNFYHPAGTVNDVNFKVWRFSGYINIEVSGTYTFMSYSDDASDTMIDGNVVTSAYGYHSMYQGTPPPDAGSSIELAAGYHLIQIRLVEWGGDEGYRLWWKPPGQKYFTEVPESVYFKERYDTSASQIALLRNTITQFESKLSDIDSFKKTLESSSQEYVINLMRQCIGKQMSLSADSVSAFDRVYLFVGNPTTNLRMIISLDQPQVLIRGLLDLSTSAKMIQSPYGIVTTSLPVYTMGMWIYVASEYSNYRSVVYYGVASNPINGVIIIPNMTARDRMSILIAHKITSGNMKMVSISDERAPKYGEWFHLAYSINQNIIKTYINGVEYSTENISESSALSTFVWDQNTDPKMYVGTNPTPNSGMETPPTSPIYIQQLTWYNKELSSTQIDEMYKLPKWGTIKPVTCEIGQSYSSLSELLRNAVDGVNKLRVGQDEYCVYVRVTGSEKWLLILNYEHKQGTNPELYVRKDIDGFPMYGDRLDFDGSAEEGKPRWGHLGNAFLTRVYDSCGGFKKMLFYAKNSNGKVIHFKTADTGLIEYAKTGNGKVSDNFSSSWEPLSGHNASIPDSATNSWSGQGDYALTEYPFFRYGDAHWGIRGWQGRWEVDDQNVNPHTVHQVYIGF